jgi:hypothetical protein
MKDERVRRRDRRGGVLYVSSELLESFRDLMIALVAVAGISLENDEDKDWRQRSLMERAKEEGMSKQRKTEYEQAMEDSGKSEERKKG